MEEHMSMNERFLRGELEKMKEEKKLIVEQNRKIKLERMDLEAEVCALKVDVAELNCENKNLKLMFCYSAVDMTKH